MRKIGERHLDVLMKRLGISEGAASSLLKAGHVSVRRVRSLSDKEIVDLPSIGEATLSKIRGQ